MVVGDDLEAGAEKESSRRSLRSGSSTESERRRSEHTDAEGRHSTRSLKEKRRRSARDSALPSNRVWAAAGVLCGLLVAVFLMGLLSNASQTAGVPLEASRVIHLCLAGNEERKARFGLSKSISWDLFLSGVRDRLGIASISRIETSEGVLIKAVEDLLHRDNLVVYEGTPLRHSAYGSLGVVDDFEERWDAGGRHAEMRGGVRTIASARRAMSERATAQNPIASWAVDDVVTFFTELKLKQYIKAIRTHEVSGPMLLEVEKDTEALGELGITSKLHVSKIRSSLRTLDHATA